MPSWPKINKEEAPCEWTFDGLEPAEIWAPPLDYKVVWRGEASVEWVAGQVLAAETVLEEVA